MVGMDPANPGREKARKLKAKWQKRIAELEVEDMDRERAETLRDQFRKDEISITTSLPRRGNIGETIHIIKEIRVDLEAVLGAGPPGPRPRTRFEKILGDVKERVKGILSRR
jgi:hypothetical protein